MIGQAAKGLSADDVGGARVDQLQHFRRQQPTFPHLAPFAQVAVYQPVQILEGAGGFEVVGVVQGINHVPLALFHIAFEDGTPSF